MQIKLRHKLGFSTHLLKNKSVLIGVTVDVANTLRKVLVYGRFCNVCILLVNIKNFEIETACARVSYKVKKIFGILFQLHFFSRKLNRKFCTSSKRHYVVLGKSL